jgi:hypothetical protein
MKIINERTTENFKSVGSCVPGKVVQFNKRFYQDYPPNDLYLILSVCSTYADRTRNKVITGKIGIANLETGMLSFVSPDREVTVMDAEVTVNGPSN